MQYLQQNSELTLREGLTEYTQNYPFLNKNDAHDEASTWFKKHDITHVLFGTRPFEIRGESINDTWTLFGSDVGLKGYMTFFKFVNYKVVMNSYVKKHHSKMKVYWIMLKQIPICGLTMFRALRMKKKWHWHHYEDSLDCKLADLRREYNIKVIY